MSKTLEVAAAQMAPVLLDRDATVSEVCDWIKKSGLQRGKLNCITMECSFH